MVKTEMTQRSPKAPASGPNPGDENSTNVEMVDVSDHRVIVRMIDETGCHRIGSGRLALVARLGRSLRSLDRQHWHTLGVDCSGMSSLTVTPNRALDAHSITWGAAGHATSRLEPLVPMTSEVQSNSCVELMASA